MPPDSAEQRLTTHAPAPTDLTIGDCLANRYDVTVWCTTRGCPGRELDISRLTRWADHGLVSLALAGRLKCRRCKADAGAITVGQTMRADRIMSWQRGRA